jgi:hypothetical protein
LREAVDAFQKARQTEGLDQLPPAVVIRGYLDVLRGLTARIPAALDAAAADLELWSADVAGPARPGEDPDSTARIRRNIDEARKEILLSRKDIGDGFARIDAAWAAATDATKAEAYEALLKQTQAALNLLDSVTTIQTQAKIHRIKLPEVAIGPDEALEYAKAHRLDLQNLTGRVTDAWRKVTVAANALRGDVTVTARADVNTDPLSKNPLAFSADDSRFAVNVFFDGPLNRQAERNAYRASLITYQRARRAYMALSDSIEQSVRNDLRQLALQRVSFEISRLQVITNVRRVEAARLKAQDQEHPSPTATLDTLNALRDLLDARNNFVQNYVSYLQQRIQLFLDLEALQLDDRGFPCDLDLFRPGPAPPGPPSRPPARPVGSYAGDAPATK